MRVAVIADIHANLHALEAVAKRLETEALDELWCAGDLVGYNAQPNQVVAWVRSHVDVVVAGNHDVDVVTRAAQVGTTAAAQHAQAWTRAQLGDSERQYLASLPNHHVGPGGIELAHGCYLNDWYFTGYVTMTTLSANLHALAPRAEDTTIGVCGHTHQPMLGWLRDTIVSRVEAVGEVSWPTGADSVLVNPGSVGQPRDRDPRASFAIINTESRTVEFHRCEYDVEGARRAIEQATLPIELGDRLREGR